MDVWLAVVLPFLLMVGVTRVTFSVIGACIVTWMVMLFAFQFYEKPWYLLVISFVSFFIGIFVARKKLQKKQGM